MNRGGSSLRRCNLPAGCFGLAAVLLGACAVAPVPPANAPATAPRVVPTAAWAAGDAAREHRRHEALVAGNAVLEGGTVGYYMDVQEARLREQLAGTGAEVARVGDDLSIRLPGAATFAADRADLDSHARAVLDPIGSLLQKYDKSIVEVAAYSDSAGAPDVTLALSERRAATVAAYLAGRGVAPRRVTVVGMGAARPIASNLTAEGRSRNRRVELTLSPLIAPGR